MASSSSSSPELLAASAASSSQESAYANFTRAEVFEDLSSRFILNLPQEELASVERVCFQVEQAHWYYEDFIREQNPHKFPSYTLKTFSEALFRACPILADKAADHERTFASFMQYKTRVPVCGAIMLNDTWDKCVLVKGWKSSAGWGFPKGKINEQEPKHRCAIREVLEETGYDLENQLDPENVLQMSIREQSISLYIVPGVPEDFHFETRTRKEISRIAWFRLSDLPTWKRNKIAPGKFYLISPFIGPLKAFIHDRKPRNLPRKVPRPITQAPQETHASSEEDAAASIEQSPSSLVDNNAQELSSQSSSADNGEPHTPSPQYSAARVHQPSFDTGDNARVENPIVNGSTAAGMDPALARLFDRLTLSVGSLPLEQPEPAKLATAETMPALSSVPPPREPSPQEPTVSPDWSAHAPPHRPPTYLRDKLSHARSSPTVSARSADPTPVPAASPLQPMPATSPTLKASSHGRRSSASTADLSPYLSRPKGITKEMKYISMLESVAQESDRVASRMGHRPPIPTPQGLSSYPPHPPPSVPPEMIYSSASAPLHQFTRAFPHPMPYSPHHMNGFAMRPSTSMALHHPPPHSAMVPRQSMNEAQLRALLPLNGHGPVPGPSTPFGPIHGRVPMASHHMVPPHRPLMTPNIGERYQSFVR
ncbi:DCP2-domain-containing protein [Trametes versicolor FP-101664 SS1]|uniref:DCP2-domain-containing protein n=1 Tax=Trametes versicolor (strain FP-101664) TaxID=717944 RepID=UPI0004622F56|nr:DCP2-domain-containing protein [Trametes versicolor FP-101664 SS1]EIW64651.1 DCP2-domain-containing protein [Trametes versicolor FP-101664 SS1]